MTRATVAATRTPLRVSFAGGGTDLPRFTERRVGVVVSTAIDRYVFVRAERSREPEAADTVDSGLGSQIVRACREVLGTDMSVRVTVRSQVPMGAGLGGSASFTVGVLHALHLLLGEQPSPQRLAEEACRVEIDLLGRPVGRQDQYAAAFGGVNALRLGPGVPVAVEPIPLDHGARAALFESLLVLWTGVSRDAGAILQAQQSVPEEQLLMIRNYALRLREMLAESVDVVALGALLHETWQVKRSLSTHVSTPVIDSWYERARAAGALGGKLCGAGGGGCLLLVVPPDLRPLVRTALPELTELRIGYADRGSDAVPASSRRPVAPA